MRHAWFAVTVSATAGWEKVVAVIVPAASAATAAVLTARRSRARGFMSLASHH
jgi:hypothetical protein